MRNLFFAAVTLLGLNSNAQAVDGGKISGPEMSASVAQLSGKWEISKIVTPKQVDIPQDKIKGSYFVFGADHTYRTQIIGVEEKGSWQLGPKNRSIELLSKGGKTLWNIISIDASELVMRKGTRGNTVTFIR